MRIVLDTNVWISALISPGGTPAQLLAQLLAPLPAPSHILLISPEILAEITRVLGYPKIAKRYGASEQIAQQYIDKISRAALFIQTASVPTESIIAVDPSDDKFLHCAMTGDADCIVSGDRHLKDLGSHQGIPVLSPVDFLNFLASL